MQHARRWLSPRAPVDAHDTIDIALASDRELITRANDIRDRLKRSIQRDMSDARLVRSVDIAHVLDTVACEPFGCDTMLGHIALLDAGTANAVVGPVPSDELQEDHRDMPQVSFASADGMQFLTLFFHYGGVIDEFSELRVSRRRPLTVRSALPSTDLVSGRGLALDMSEKEVRKVLGENARHGVDMQGHRYLRYRLDDISTSDLLRRYNYPSYYAHLEFEDDKLVEYRFGFDYP